MRAKQIYIGPLETMLHVEIVQHFVPHMDAMKGNSN